jgi:hypothetical protein
MYIFALKNNHHQKRVMSGKNTDINKARASKELRITQGAQ